ncbi:MAG: Na(+)/H(+) antiporter subunit F [Elusimicrobia bacterium]|nr:Na(+)/H(+) antiporter subunit F [Elusimicrobiota bacterium]
MIQTVASFCLWVLFACLLATLYRVVKGPSMADRVLAADVIFMNLIAIIVVYSIKIKTPFYFDLVIVFSLLGFVATVTFAKFLGRGRILE